MVAATEQGSLQDATIAALISAAARKLGSPSPRLDAELLLAHALGCSRTALLRDRDEIVAVAQHERFLGLLDQRLRGMPIAYLLGAREFWSLVFEVTQDTLIPRPETELLVETALSLIPDTGQPRIADLGTGTGAVALAIAHERPRARVTATDLSAAALDVAQRNAMRMGIANVEFRAGDWLAPLAQQRYDVMVSNPPYIAARDPHLDDGDVRFEPRFALTSGADGLDAIRHIVANVPAHLAEAGWLLLEHGATQGTAVRALLTAHAFHAVTTYRDLAGHERVSVGHWMGDYG